MSTVVPFNRKAAKMTVVHMTRSESLESSSERPFSDKDQSAGSDKGPFEIIRGYQAKAPVPVTKLAEALGLPVFEESGWPDRVSGLIERADPEAHASSGYQIVIRKEDAEVRKRFTIAHEIAHYILHRDQIGDRLQDNALYRSNLSSKDEAEANQLAADILMPRDLIEQHLEHGRMPSLEHLAQEFQVSRIAMAIRLGIPTD